MSARDRFRRLTRSARLSNTESPSVLTPADVHADLHRRREEWADKSPEEVARVREQAERFEALIEEYGGWGVGGALPPGALLDPRFRELADEIAPDIVLKRPDPDNDHYAVRLARAGAVRFGARFRP